MRKTISVIHLLAFLLLSQCLFAQTANYSYTVSPKDIYEGYISEKIWLNGYAVPKITVTNVSYIANTELPKDAKVSDPGKFRVRIGMELKKPFAIVNIPVFTTGAAAGQVNRVSSFSLTVSEQPKPARANASRTTDVTTSALATGTWYKIAVLTTGFYKIDFNFLTGMGLTPSNINPADIRIFGNGGHMLSKITSVPRPSDLIENAILVNNPSGGDKFDNAASVIFYAVGPTEWDADTTNKVFTHIKNIFSDTAYYFITFDQGVGKRISTQAATTSGNINVNTFNYYDVHDTDIENPADFGQIWYGEEFISQLGNNTQTFSFNMGSTPVSQVSCNLSFGENSETAGSSIELSLNGADLGTSYYDTPTEPSGSGDVMEMHYLLWAGTCNSSTANVGLTFKPADGNTTGYLNYIEINTRLNLAMNGDQMNFRDLASTGAGNVANYQLQGSGSGTSVWDVSDPQNPVIMKGNLNGSAYTFTQDAQTLHEFAAVNMNSTNLYTPKYEYPVPNQNLHGVGQMDCIIVTYPDFLPQAQQLEAYHQSHDNLRVTVATTSQIYNEFSSGGQDISAIRDFVRMFYVRAGSDATQIPRYLILLGGASYDYKNRLANNSNFVPVYESAESLNDLGSFCTDDFYGFLDSNDNIEDISIINTLDLGVGRLPARSADDATSLVNKVTGYKQPATLGPWRVSATFVADLGCVPNPNAPPPFKIDDAGNHMTTADSMASELITAGQNRYNEEKIYVDALPIISTPAGSRCPPANAALDQQVFNGTFLINYNGHGNPTVWSTERILTDDDFNNWNNVNSLPLLITATCDFGQFDQPTFVSSAEQMVLKSGGGVIAALTTTESVYENFNYELNQQFLSAQFTKNAANAWNALGDANRIGKNITYAKSFNGEEIANFRKFSLLGDPAVIPDFPQYSVRLDSVTDGATLQHADTIKALGKYFMYGHVVDNSGNLLSGFNGLLSVSFFDKPRTVNTISGCNEQYQVQDNLVYKGRVSVINGQYTFSFITPKDINYYLGTGKLSTYANDSVTDAAGMDTSLTVGGFSDNPVMSSTPPVVKPYINDSLFLNGGITGPNTSLFVTFYDETGINVSGNDVGHNLTGVLDGNVEEPYNLNDYYQTQPNTYQHGYLTYAISGLAEGKHSITVRAWDVNDNMGEGTVDFVVINGKVVDIQQLGNYPNPFTNTTNFVFEHNQPGEQLNVQIEIYNVAGALVKNINEAITPTGSRTNEISWDGTSNNGQRLPSGVYVYRLNVTTSAGFKSSAYQKLVIVR